MEDVEDHGDNLDDSELEDEKEEGETVDIPEEQEEQPAEEVRPIRAFFMGATHFIIMFCHNSNHCHTI